MPSGRMVPYVDARISVIPQTDGLQLSPPIWWHTSATALNLESGSGISDGRYNESLGEIHGAPIPTLQDTYLSTTASGRSGRKFTVSTGTWKDDYVSPWSDKYGLMQTDATVAAWSVSESTTPTTGLLPTLVVLRMGVAPANNSTAHSSTTKAVLELANGEVYNYRLYFGWNQPVHLDFSADSGTSWTTVAVCRSIPDVETYLSQNNNTFRIGIFPDAVRKIMNIEIGTGNWLRHSPSRDRTAANAGAVSTLWPNIQKYKFYGAYRWSTLECYPLTFGNPTVTKAPQYYDNAVLNNIGQAKVLTNLAGSSDPSQTVASTITKKSDGGITVAVTATTTGSKMPRLSDIVVYIPSQWVFNEIGLPPPMAQLPTMLYEEHQVWSDGLRIGETTGRLICSNHSRAFNNQFGNYALAVGVGNGFAFNQRLRGMVCGDAEGITVVQDDPERYASLPVRDFWAKLEQPIGQGVILDGLCLYTAIRLIMDICQVNPNMFCAGELVNDVGFPGPSGYGDNFPFYILGKGTGLNPKYEFGPDTTGKAVILALLQDSGPVNAGGSATPYYMFTQPDGALNLQAYDPTFMQPVMAYSDIDPSGYGQVTSLKVHNSIENIRTNICIQGQDAFTYELLQQNLSLFNNIAMTGYQKNMLLRNARYSTPSYMLTVLKTAARYCSLPTQIVEFDAPYWPHVCAGNLVIGSFRETGGAFIYQVLEIHSRVGHEPYYRGPAQTHCSSKLICRSVANAIPF